MRIIAERTLKIYWTKEPEAEQPLKVGAIILKKLNGIIIMN